MQNDFTSLTPASGHGDNGAQFVNENCEEGEDRSLDANCGSADISKKRHRPLGFLPPASLDDARTQQHAPQQLPPAGKEITLTLQPHTPSPFTDCSSSSLLSSLSPRCSSYSTSSCVKNDDEEVYTQCLPADLRRQTTAVHLEQEAVVLPRAPHIAISYKDDSSFRLLCDSVVGNGTTRRNIMMAGPSTVTSHRTGEDEYTERGGGVFLSQRIHASLVKKENSEQEGECRTFSLDPSVFECRSISALTESELGDDAADPPDDAKKRSRSEQQKRGWTERCVGSMCVLFDDYITAGHTNKNDGEFRCSPPAAAAASSSSSNVKGDEISQFKRRRSGEGTLQLCASEQLPARGRRGRGSLIGSSINAGDLFRGQGAEEEYSLHEYALDTDMSFDENRLLWPSNLHEWSAMLNQCSEVSRELSDADSATTKHDLSKALLALYTVLDNSSAAVGAEDLLRDHVKERRHSLARVH